MRTTLIITALLALLLFTARADDVRFRNGQTLKNCLVLDTLGSRIKVKTSDGDRLFPLTSIDNILKSQFDSTQTSMVQNRNGSTQTLIQVEQPFDVNIQTRSQHIYVPEKHYDYPNSILLPLSAVAFGLAWDYFSQAGDIQDAIDANNSLASALKIQIDNSRLESQKSRKSILGVTFIAAGILNTVFALRRVEVTTTNNSIGLSYKF